MTAIGVKGVISVDLGVTDSPQQGLLRKGLASKPGVGNQLCRLFTRQRPISSHSRASPSSNGRALENQSDGAGSSISGHGCTPGSPSTKPSLIEAPAESSEPDGGYGFAFKDPEGRTVRILTNDHRQTTLRRS